MPSIEQNLDDILSILPGLPTGIQGVQANLDALVSNTSNASSASREFADSILAMDGGGVAGVVTGAISKIRQKARSVAIASHDIEVAVSRAYLLDKTNVGSSNPLPTISNDFFKITLHNSPDVVINPIEADSCKVLATDQIGISTKVKLSSSFSNPQSETGFLWFTFSLQLNTTNNTLGMTQGRGARLCGAGAVLDSLDPFWYKRQIGDHPLTRPSLGVGNSAQPVCNPANPDCRHLRSFLDQNALSAIAQNASSPIDFNGPVNKMAAALGVQLAVFDFAVFPNVSVFAKASNVVVRPQEDFLLLEELETIAPSANAGVKIHKSLIDRVVRGKMLNLLDQFREENLGDNQELLANIDSVTFEEDPQSIAVIVSVTLKDKEVFPVEIPYVGNVGSVTMRVTKDRTLLLRAKPVVAAGSLKLNVRQEAVLADHDPDIEFQPLVVDVLSNSMQGFLEAFINLMAALAPALDETVDILQSDDSIAVQDFTIGADRLAIFVNIDS